MPNKVCKVEGCSRSDIKAHGLCELHYRRFLRTGQVGTPYKKEIAFLRRKAPHEYNVWKAMTQRCTNPQDKAYKDYGGRGIKVCDRWRGRYGFKNFITDMGLRPKGEYNSGYSKYSIDRINNDGDYCPENCRWTNRRVQRINQRRTKEYVAFGTKGTWSELYAKFSLPEVSEKTAWRRFKQLGWDIEEAISKPVMK